MHELDGARFLDDWDREEGLQGLSYILGRAVKEERVAPSRHADGEDASQPASSCSVLD